MSEIADLADIFFAAEVGFSEVRQVDNFAFGFVALGTKWGRFITFPKPESVGGIAPEIVFLLEELVEKGSLFV